MPVGVTQVEQERLKGSWRFYVVSGLGILLTVLLVAAAVYFREQIEHAEGYGYAGVFFVGILCGITIIPAPTLLLVFTLGSVLKPILGPEYLGPVYVGLVAGFGGALGGITVYLTGAGAETIWSRVRSKMPTLAYRPDSSDDSVRTVRSRFWSRGEAFYNRLANWMGGRGGYLTLFIVAALPISPFYFAGLAAGSLRMGLWRFFLVSWAGKTVRYLIIAFAGYWGLHYLLQWIGA